MDFVNYNSTVENITNLVVSLATTNLANNSVELTLTAANTLRKDFVILQLYWWLFSSTKYCCSNMV